jgi:hypothetical protein
VVPRKSINARIFLNKPAWLLEKRSGTHVQWNLVYYVGKKIVFPDLKKNANVFFFAYRGCMYVRAIDFSYLNLKVRSLDGMLWAWISSPSKLQPWRHGAYPEQLILDGFRPNADFYGRWAATPSSIWWPRGGSLNFFIPASELNGMIFWSSLVEINACMFSSGVVPATCGWPWRWAHPSPVEKDLVVFYKFFAWPFCISLFCEVLFAICIQPPIMCSK